MQIVHMTKFVLGIVFLLVAIGMAISGRRERGFGKSRQVAALCFVAFLVFTGVGLGYFA